MIYVTGDCHGNFHRLSYNNFPKQKEMKKSDFVVILGDIGFFYPEKNMDPLLDELEQKPFTTLFVDGNHEDFDALNAFPVSLWHGGKVHFVRPSVIHLMRGQYYTDVCGKNIFSFGGAESGDRAERQEHVSWWKEEKPSEEELREGLRNLAEHKNEADFIFSHEGPDSDIMVYSKGEFKGDTTTQYLQTIKDRLEDRYTAWYFGHHHHDMALSEKDLMVYERIVRIA